MFDEMLPGGLMGAYGMSPMMMGMSPFMGMQQYKQPGSDVFGEMGIMSPQQQMFQGIQMQNMLQQNQLAREQQMMALQSMSMNMGANAAQVGSGFAGPMLMQMGGLKPAWTGQLQDAISGGVQAYANRGQNPSMNPGGMTPVGPNIMSSMDPNAVISRAMQENGGDPAKAYMSAGATLSQMADQTGNDQLRQMAVRLQQKAYELSQSEAASASSTNKNNADAAEANARAASVQAAMVQPRPMGVAHNAQGETGIAWSEYNPQTMQYEEHSGFYGVPIQYQIPSTPGGMQENQDQFRSMVTSGIATQQRINKIIGLIQSPGGAAVGWTSKGVGYANDLLGTFQQLAPGATLDSTGEDALNKLNGTFQGWANKTEMTESYFSDLTMSLAGVYAHGQRISNVDVTRAANTLGESIGNPKSLIPVLQSVSQRAGQDIDNAAGAYQIGGTKQYQGSIEQLRQYYHSSIAHLQQPTAPAQDSSNTTMSLDDYLKAHGH